MRSAASRYSGRREGLTGRAPGDRRPGSAHRESRTAFGQGALVRQCPLSALWGTGATGSRDDGHLRRLQLVLRALSLAAPPQRSLRAALSGSVAPGGYLRGWSGARGDASALFPLLEPGDEGARADLQRGTGETADHPGNCQCLGRSKDVQALGKRGRAGLALSEVLS